MKLQFYSKLGCNKNCLRVLSTMVLLMISLESYTQNWQQLGADLNGEAVGDFCGSYADISSDGNTVAVGAQNNDGVNGVDSGHVRVFTFNGTEWVQKGDDLDGEAASDNSGVVALSANGNTIAVGAPYNDNSGSSSGHVRVFDYDGSIWVQRGLTIPSETAHDHAGTSVDISADGNRVAIGSRDHRSSGLLTGQVRVFGWDGAAWIKLGSDMNGEVVGDQLGEDVNISADGTVVVMGAPYADINGNGSGKMVVYQYNGSDWIVKGEPIAGVQANGNFGMSVDISADGNTIIGGEPNFGNNNGVQIGRVRVFSWNGNAWIQKGQSIDGIGNNDRSGQRVSISPNGNQLAIRSLLSVNGVNNLTGKTKTYLFDGTNWVPFGGVIGGQNTGDNSGFGLAFSTDGETIIIGSILNNNNGNQSGHARVFRLDGSLSMNEQVVSKIKLYPNPVANYFTIDLLKNFKEVNLQVVSVIGQVIINENASNVRVIQKLLDVPVGIYFIKLKLDDVHSITFKIIKL